MAQVLALGDCNTLGVGTLKGDAYPEHFAKAIGKTIVNSGYTMSTTREMICFFNDFKDDETEIILIQYGLVDSWKTFRYSPYVLYYPENRVRKVFRKIVKKYKKIAKQVGLNRWLGMENVVPLEEYRKNIESLIHQARNCKIFLIDTIPNQETFRNAEIQKYNNALIELAQKYENVYHIDVYDSFLSRDELYLDQTHMNKKGYTLIAERMIEAYNSISSAKSSS